MRKPFATTGMLFITLIVLLGAIGVVNGLWSKNLVVNGTVTTGDLNADWDCAWTNDDGQATDCAGTANDEASDDGLDPAPGDADFIPATGFTYNTPFVKKDVAECHVAIATGGEFGAQVANVTINNAYPSYECRIVLLLSNTGSIPFNVIGVFPALGSNTTGLEFLDANGTDEGVCTAALSQVDPPVAANDGSNEKRIECVIHVKQAAAQSVCSATAVQSPNVVVTEDCAPTTLQYYHFALNACVAQWNEEASFQQCKGGSEFPDTQHEGPSEVTPPAPHVGPLP